MIPRLLHRPLAAALLLASLASAAARTQVAGDNVAPRPAPGATAPSHSGLAERIDAVLDRPSMRRVEWGIEVRDASSGRVLYARGADRRMIPASNLKLVVAAAAAHHLPADYRYRTTLHAAGPVEGGVLRGDLVLAGRGDPLISARYGGSRTAVFEALADSLLARGVRRVTGGVVADDSWFDRERVRSDWDAYDLRWWYAAPVGALGFNDNSVDVRIAPGAAAGSAPRITFQPQTSYVTLVNAATTVAAGRPATLDLERLPGQGRIRAYGQIPLGTAADVEYFAVDDPARFTGTVFREVLERKGIDVAVDEVRVVSDPAASVAESAPVLAEHRSEPLTRVIGPILRNSQNWFAEQLVKTLGREVRGQGSWDAGLAVEREFLTTVVGLDSADFALRDGSGLSEGNAVTPRGLVKLLDYVRRTPGQEAVRAALPVSGGEGSLKARFPTLPGRVAAKTGYIGDVDSLSGFLTLRDGRTVIFAIIANQTNQPSARMKAAIDDIVRAIDASGGG